MTGCLLLGDVMAVLAEGQNRQECGVDRYAGVRQYTGRLFPVAQTDEKGPDWQPILEEMADDVSIKVAVDQAWGSGTYPAFSLRRVYLHAEPDACPASYRSFLHELIVHRMISYGTEYSWDWEHNGGNRKQCVCKVGEYEANLLGVKSYQEGYLADCSHIFRLLSDV